MFNFALLVVLSAGRAVVADQAPNPVGKVITLLKDMQSQLQAEAKSDEDLYDELSCWCTKNRKSKGASVSAATDHSANLKHDIEKFTSKENGLKGSISDLESEIESNTNALNEATALREKNAAEFNQDENEMVSSIQALTNALTVLAKHQSFLQTDSSVNAVTASLKHVVESNDDLIAQILKPDDRKALKNFVQVPGYANKSGQIYGVLEQLKTNFEKNLDESRAGEAKALGDYTDLKNAKTSEIAAAKEQVSTKKKELAATLEALENAKEDLADTTAQLNSDEAFLADLEARCKVMNAEWAERSKTRQMEIAAVGEAITILSEDDAHDTFKASLSFLQTGSLEKENTRRDAAAKVLERAAMKSRSQPLAALATSVQLDAFTKVKAAIDEMISTLKTEADEEVKHKDFCNEELHSNDVETTEKEQQAEDLKTTIDSLVSHIDTTAKDIATLESEVADMQVELKRASEDRVAENREFQQTIADQRATQVILKKALARLAKFYNRAFVQEAVEQPMPHGFTPYHDNKASGSAMTMIQNIVTDSSNLEKDAIKAEQDAQTAYEAFVSSTNASVEQAQRNIVNKKEVKAKGETEKAAADADLDTTQQNIKSLGEYKGSLHASCDFVLKNFEIRQKGRQEEIESLQQAKSILSGAA